MSWLPRAAVLEKMPVMDRSSMGQTNGESGGGGVQELEPTKPKQPEMMVAPQPASQVGGGEGGGGHGF